MNSSPEKNFDFQSKNRDFIIHDSGIPDIPGIPEFFEAVYSYKQKRNEGCHDK